MAPDFSSLFLLPVQSAYTAYICVGVWKPNDRPNSFTAESDFLITVVYIL
jgi:hypothetical protein